MFFAEMGLPFVEPSVVGENNASTPGGESSLDIQYVPVPLGLWASGPLGLWASVPLCLSDSPPLIFLLVLGT